MKSEMFKVPQTLNMGFHYTIQYSRRTRVCVMGLVDQGSEEWARWYLRTHEPAAMREIAEAGYSVIEVHFLYGFGLEGEREEWERTRKLVANAHDAGLRALGYFQFQSVQSETFFLENPWARAALQVGSDGKPREHKYNRPTLCFTHPQVRQYFLDGMELGLKVCDLDGIRLDNDYCKGCYCSRCRDAFRQWLRETFNETEARRIFGLPNLEGMSPAPKPAPRDPLWAATVKFRRRQRQDMMRVLNKKIRSIKPHAILGGNPGVARGVDGLSKTHVYPPDLGQTHHLVCAENSRFPARSGDATRHQVCLYKHGQANDFAVFASHHIYLANGGVRWPASVEECALSLCEGLAFGGHPACTSWGIRMDGSEDRYLYQRPAFRRALDPITDFLDRHKNIYEGAKCSALTGVYINSECLTMDSTNAWLSFHGSIQALLQNQIPFRLVDRDDDSALADVKVLLVPDMRYLSNAQVQRFRSFADGGGKLILTGKSGLCDEWGLKREDEERDELWSIKGAVRWEGTPEKITFETGKAHQDWLNTAGGARHPDTPLPAEHRRLASTIRELLPENTPRVYGSPFVALDTFMNSAGERFLHLLNYDNNQPCDLCVILPGNLSELEIVMPEGLGVRREPRIGDSDKSTAVELSGLHTYCVIHYRENNS